MGRNQARLRGNNGQNFRKHLSIKHFIFDRFKTWNKTTSKSYSGNSLLWIGQLHTSHAPWAGVEEHTEAIETICKKHSFANLAYPNGVGITEIKNLKHLDIRRTFVIVSSQNYYNSQCSILHLPCSWLQFCSYAMFYQHFSGSCWQQLKYHVCKANDNTLILIKFITSAKVHFIRNYLINLKSFEGTL